MVTNICFPHSTATLTYDTLRFGEFEDFPETSDPVWILGREYNALTGKHPRQFLTFPLRVTKQDENKHGKWKESIQKQEVQDDARVNANENKHNVKNNPLITFAIVIFEHRLALFL